MTEVNNNDNYICDNDTVLFNKVSKQQVKKKHILEDCWKNIIEFISIIDFNSFSKVCKYFYIILKESNYYKVVKNLFNNFVKKVKVSISDFNYLYFLKDSDNLVNEFRKLNQYPNYKPIGVFLKEKNLTKLSNLEYNLFELLLLKKLLFLNNNLPNEWISENNYEIYFKVLQKHNYYSKTITFIPEVFKNDKEFALNVVNNHPSLFSYFSEEIQKDISLLTICLDNLIKNLNETINLSNEMRQYIYGIPELFIKLYSKERYIAYHTPQRYLTNYFYEGKPVYYKLIEIYPKGVEQYYSYQPPLADTTICKLLVEKNCFGILKHLSTSISSDINFLCELIIMNDKVLSHLSNTIFYYKDFITKIFNLLPDILDYETESKDDIIIKRNLGVDIDFIVRKLGVTSLLYYQHSFDPIKIMSKYSTRILKFSHLKEGLEKSKLELQAAYIDRKRKELLANNSNDKRIIVPPLSRDVENCLLTNCYNTLSQTLKILETDPYLFPYCSEIIKKDKTVQQLVFYSEKLTIDEKVKCFNIMKSFIYNDKNLIEEFLNHCIYIAPLILNNENCDFFIDKFIPLFIKNIIQENGFTIKLKEMLNNIVIPKEWSGNGNLIEKSITTIADGLVTQLEKNQFDELKTNLLKIFKISNKEIGLKYVKENVDYWNVFDDSIKLDLNILNVLILQKTNDKLFVSNILTMIVTKEKKRLKEYIEIIKIIISIDPTLINLLPLDLQLNYNILQIIFEKDILNCIKYLPIGILDSFKMLIFDSVKINERKYILQQFKERYNNELKNTNK
ncbi:hypothetical protein ABK040_002538 [Willaertia magna]